MIDSILISIRPEWCERILSGEKTIEVRKTRPKIDTPFRCYIYCTKPKFPHEDFLVFDAGTNKVKAFYGGGMVVGDFTCDSIAEFIVPFPAYMEELDPKIKQESCLTYMDLHNYAGHRNLFGWHISDLRIYDEPKPLKRFQIPTTYPARRIRKPPQSWCYAEEIV